VDEKTEVVWTESEKSNRGKLVLESCLCTRDAHGKGRPHRATRCLYVALDEKNNRRAATAWVQVLTAYIQAAQVRRVERDRHSLAFPRQMPLE